MISSSLGILVYSDEAVNKKQNANPLINAVALLTHHAATALNAATHKRAVLAGLLLLAPRKVKHVCLTAAHNRRTKKGETT